MDPEPVNALTMAELSLIASRQDSHVETSKQQQGQPQSQIADQSELSRASSGTGLNATAMKEKSSLQVVNSSSIATSRSTPVVEKPRRVSNLRKTTSHKRAHDAQNVPVLAVSVFIA